MDSWMNTGGVLQGRTDGSSSGVWSNVKVPCFSISDENRDVTLCARGGLEAFTQRTQICHMDPRTKGRDKGWVKKRNKELRCDM